MRIMMRALWVYVGQPTLLATSHTAPTRTPRAEPPWGRPRRGCLHAVVRMPRRRKFLWRPSGRTSPKVPWTGATVQTGHPESAPCTSPPNTFSARTASFSTETRKHPWSKPQQRSKRGTGGGAAAIARAIADARRRERQPRSWPLVPLAPHRGEHAADGATAISPDHVVCSRRPPKLRRARSPRQQPPPLLRQRGRSRRLVRVGRMRRQGSTAPPTATAQPAPSTEVVTLGSRGRGAARVPSGRLAD